MCSKGSARKKLEKFTAENSNVYENYFNLIDHLM